MKKRQKESWKFYLSTNKNFLIENIFTANHFSYFISVKFLSVEKPRGFKNYTE